VWANHTVFLDFFAEGSKEVWGKGLQTLDTLLDFDGLWLDMNEATGFCNGECPDGIIPVPNNTNSLSDDAGILNQTWWYGYTDQTNISTYTIPFIPGGKWNLDNMSMSLNASHPSTNDTQYNTHSLYGHSEGKATREILLNSTLFPENDRRPFLLARSTFAGSGQYVQHWLGDNHGTWEDMKHSIAGVMNFQMFGIPMVGPDTCGFFATAGNDELCARWIQLATFYPFARQHRDINAPSNEPWTMVEPYQTMAKNALYDRLQYVRNMYTCLFGLTQDGGSCFDPLFFHYPHLDAAFNDIEHTFIAQDSLKVSPCLEPNGTNANQTGP
jgi:alpha-glucosidase (family GH31 glycosyl hydrolase)